MDNVYWTFNTENQVCTLAWCGLKATHPIHNVNQRWTRQRNRHEFKPCSKHAFNYSWNIFEGDTDFRKTYRFICRFCDTSCSIDAQDFHQGIGKFRRAMRRLNDAAQQFRPRTQIFTLSDKAAPSEQEIYLAVQNRIGTAYRDYKLRD